MPWKIEHQNDTYPDGDGGSTYAEWWNVTDGKRTFRVDYQDDAELLLAGLTAVAEIDRLREECARLRADAERYRWMKREVKRIPPGWGLVGWDAAIDAALKGKP